MSQELDEKSQESSSTWSCLTLASCKCFHTIRCFMVFYCFQLWCHGLVFGLLKLNIAYFVKANHLNTIENLGLSFIYEISSGLASVFVAYFGGRGHRPRWIAFSSLLIGVASLLLSYPYVTARNYRLNIEIEDICQSRKLIGSCPDTSVTFNSKYVYFFITGEVLLGIAALPLFILGRTFLDDNLHTHSIGTYLGIGEAATITGFAAGTAVGTLLIKISLNNVMDKSMQSLRWQQSWRNYFIVAAFLSWLPFIPLFCFPHSLPDTEMKRDENSQQSVPTDDNLVNQKFEPTIKNLFASVWILIKNPVFLCLSLCRAAEQSLITGIAEVLPKYIENQYELSPDVALLIAGIILMPAGAFGQLIGGVIISKLRMSCKALIRFVLATSAITIVLLLPILLIHCQNGKFAGITEDYDSTGQLGSLEARCNAHCKCSTAYFSPVCGRDKIEYFSPCFAGCTESQIFHSRKVYLNCSCVTKRFVKHGLQDDFSDAEPHKCELKCFKMPLFISFIFSTIAFANFASVPLTVAILRIVSDNQHSMALGVAFVILRIFGTIPGPTIIKRTIDFSCSFHDDGICGFPGVCRIFNKTKMVYLLTGICFLFKGLSIFLTALTLCLFSRHTPKHLAILSPSEEEAIYI